MRQTDEVSDVSYLIFVASYGEFSLNQIKNCESKIENMKFIGNQKVTNLLRKSLEHGNTNHAYLFSGPERVGKFTLAKMFAESLIAGKSLSLETDMSDKNAMLDLLIVLPEISKKNNVVKQRDISVEAIREAKKSLSLFPYRGKFKVLVVDDAHKMNAASQNALLKILEEPNPTSIIILVAHEVGKILPTIKSRVQTINFALVGDDDMESFFEGEIVSFSAGRPGLARLLEKNENELAMRREAREQMGKLASGSLSEKLEMAEDLSKDIVRTIEKLNTWIWEMRRKVSEGTDAADRKEAYFKIEKIVKAMDVLKSTNASSRVVLEALFLDL